LSSYKVDNVLRFKTIVFLAIFLSTTIANAFFMPKILSAHPKPQIQISLLKCGRLFWCSSFGHKEKNLPNNRTSVPKIKFSGILFIAAFFGSLCLILALRPSTPFSINYYSLQNICITQCILRL